MRVHHLSNMKLGWIVGDFDPTVLRTEAFEVAVKHYSAGTVEARHHHKIAQEITVIVTGRARMVDRIFEAGDIIHLDAGESTGFEALEATTTVVIKSPSIATDKYLD